MEIPTDIRAEEILAALGELLPDGADFALILFNSAPFSKSYIVDARKVGIVTCLKSLLKQMES